jgi:hypothetical protein
MAPAERAAHLVEMHLQAEQSLTPIEPEYLQKVLSVTAATLQCPLPPATVLGQYMKMLGRYPKDLVEMATDEIVRQHKWNTFPRIADWCSKMDELLETRKRNAMEVEQTIAMWNGDTITLQGQSRYDNKPKGLGNAAANVLKKF